MVLASPFSSADLDRALVLRARAGDQDAFALLMDQYGGVVRRLVTRFVQDSDDARDVEQDTWIRAAEKLDSLRDEGRFRPWVKSIARHSALNFLASSKRRHDRVSTMAECGTDDFEDEDGATPEGMTLSRDNQRKVWETLGALSERDRTALFMREYQGENYAAISERLGISRNAAEVCVFRARERFRRLFIEVDGRTQACGLDPLRLSNLIDGEGDSESMRALRDHVTSCPSCDERLVTMQAGQALYRNLGAFGFPMGSGGFGIFAKLGGLFAKITSLFGGGSATAAGGGTVATGGAAIAASGGATSVILPAFAGAVVVVTSAVAATGIAVPAGAQGLPETPAAVVQEIGPTADSPLVDDPVTVRTVVPPEATPAPADASIAPPPAVAPAPDETTDAPPPTSTGPTTSPAVALASTPPSALATSGGANSTQGVVTPDPTPAPPATEGEGDGGSGGDDTPPAEPAEEPSGGPPPGQAEAKAAREEARSARAAERDEAKAARAVERDERKTERAEAKAQNQGPQPDKAAEKAGKAETKPNKPEPKAEAKNEGKPEPKTEAKSEAKPEPKADAKNEGKPEPKADAKNEGKPEPKAEAKSEPKPEPKAEPKSESKPEPKADPKAEPKNESKPDSKPEPNGNGNGNGGGKKK